LLGERAATVRGAEPSTGGGHVIVGLVQVTVIAALVLAAISQLRHRRFRLVATVAGAAVVSGLVFVAIDTLLGDDRPERLSRALDDGSWVASAHFPSAAWLAAGTAIVVALGPWLTRPWRRAASTVLVLAALARLLTGTVLPIEIVLAFAIGAVIAAGVLVAFGSPDRRIGASEVAAALAACGVPVAHVEPAGVFAKGSVPFVARTDDGTRLFVKVVGRDQRDADLLYRAYRFVRLRHLGDVRPAASLREAVEHQALVGVMAQRAGARAPQVEAVGESENGSALIAMEYVDGELLADMAPDAVTDELLVTLWRDVDHMHSSRIAHRSLRTGNVIVDRSGVPRVVDFSFSEVSATDRQLAVDRAELLASTAVLVGPQRAVDNAVKVTGAAEVATAVPLLQPLALSAATRNAVHGHADLLDRTREAAAEAAGQPLEKLAEIRRVRPRTLLMIAVFAGAFYFLLPQLAQASDAWDAFASASLTFIPLLVALSALTYVGAAISLMGTVPQRVPFGPTLLAQVAGSFVNRVTPASVGGMVLNARYLEKSGVDPATAVAGVGLNTIAGAAVHVFLTVVFFIWSGSQLGKAFDISAVTKVLLVIPVVLAIVGAVMATRWGRRKLIAPLMRGVRSAAHNLGRVSRSPVKLALLFGGSTVITLANIWALHASVIALGGTVGMAEVGAVYLAGRAVASAAPTPGNLGAIEAALVAGLTGVGVAGPEAVSAVLAYRLITYWLPALPGWLCWHLIQRYDYV
jgi:undecaprenyl-diphosphatase